MTDIAATIETLPRAERKAVSGDTIRLAPGVYSGVVFKAHQSRTGPITITAADPASPPRFTTGVTMHNARGVTFQGVDFDISMASAYFASAVRLYGGNDLRFLGGRIVGKATADDRWGHGIQADNVQGLRIAGVNASTLRRGFLLNDCTDVAVVDNDLVNIGSDGIDYSGLVRAVIARNLFKDFYPYGDDHADGIQAHSVNGARASVDVTIDDNLIWVGKVGRGKVEGIFLKSEDLTRKRGLKLRRNVLIGTGYQGIYVGHADGLELEDNLILFEKPAGDAPDKSWILVEESTGVARGNAAQLITIPRGVKSERNALNKPATAAQTSAAVATWMAKHRGAARAKPEAAYLDRRSSFDTLSAGNERMAAATMLLRLGDG